MHESYAQALWDLCAGGMKPKEAVAKINARLLEEGRESLLPHIARSFSRLAERELAKRRVILSVAREKDAAKAKRQAKDIFKELSVDAGDVVVEIEDTLIGGWRLEGREYLHDASFKNQLLSIYNAATK